MFNLEPENNPKPASVASESESSYYMTKRMMRSRTFFLPKHPDAIDMMDKYLPVHGDPIDEALANILAR